MNYQKRVMDWAVNCFAMEIVRSPNERCKRFLEEALELVQTYGLRRDEAYALVDYVYQRPLGNPHQEAGGVMVTLALLCEVLDLDMTVAGEDELNRIWTKIDEIRAKQQNKPPHIATRVS